MKSLIFITLAVLYGCGPCGPYEKSSGTFVVSGKVQEPPTGGCTSSPSSYKIGFTDGTGATVTFGVYSAVKVGDTITLDCNKLVR